MLLASGSARNETIDRHLACILAGIAGALNGAAFYAVGFFSANMTGNVSVLSDHIVLGDMSNSVFYSCIILTFIAGACLSTLIINAGVRRGYRGAYALAVLAEAGLLAVLGCAVMLLPDAAKTMCFVQGLAFVMGLQNAASTRISDARVRTTHVSGIATDIGIGLALLLDDARHSKLADDMRAAKARLGLHLVTILSFLAGGIIGIVIYRAAGPAVMWVASAILAMVAAGAFRKISKTR